MKTCYSTNLVWEKEIDGVVTYIHTGHMSTSLTLTNLNMEDSGIYRCIANNSAGSTNMLITLQVTTGNVQYSTVKCSGNWSNWCMVLSNQNPSLIQFVSYIPTCGEMY
jgi:hypothetical protein